MAKVEYTQEQFEALQKKLAGFEALQDRLKDLEEKLKIMNGAIERKLDPNFHISWRAHDQKLNRNCDVAIGSDGGLYVDGISIQKRINLEEGSSSQEAES